MYRAVLAAGLLASVAFGTSAAPVPKEKPKTFTYPTAVGTKWVYQAGKAGEREWTEEIIESEKRAEGQWFKVRFTENADSHETTYSLSNTALTNLTLMRFTLNQKLLELPPKKQATWDVDTPIQNGLLANGGKMTIVYEEEITVPAGKYKTVVVEFQVTTKNGKPLDSPSVYKYWYASECGLVRFKSDGFERTLKSFTPAKK